MRLIFFYLAHRNAAWYLNWFPSEGYCWLLKRMVETGIVDEVLVAIESGQRSSPVQYMPGLVGHAVPDLDRFCRKIGGKDIVWVRGGWKSWFPLLERLHNQGRWLLFYGANTGRERWPFWDVIFDDLSGRDFMDDLGRLHFDFRKPTNPELFYPTAIERKYDLCIGASHIHDKKGQWRGVQAAIAYKQLFGRNIKCVMPGSFRRGEKTNAILTQIKEHGLDISLPGMVTRPALARILNESKLFAHLGSGGQGDRGVLEAMRCGCPVMIGFPRYHAPFVCNPAASRVTADPDDFDALAREIHEELGLCTEERRGRVFEYHEAECGMETVILPRMRQLFLELGGGK